MNNIYLFKANDDYVTYDCYDSHVVIAENAKIARNLILLGGVGDEGQKARIEAKYKKIGTSDLKSQVVLSSFNAG